MSYTDIQLKKSGASGNTPLDLSHGELALNYADNKLYYKNDLDQIVYLTNQDTFSSISANGELLLAVSPTDLLTFYPGHAQSIDANPSTKAITFGVDETQITSFVKKTGDIMTGDLDIHTANIDANYIIVETTLYSGLATRSATPLPHLIAQFTSNSHSYTQVNTQNIDEHGSADYVITADVGSDTDYYTDVGMAGSQYNYYDGYDTPFEPLTGYFLVQGSTIGQLGGNMVIGTTTPGANIRFLSGGFENSNVVMSLENNYISIKTDLVVDGTISGPTITNIETNSQVIFNHANAAFDKANTGGGGTTLDNIALYRFPIDGYGWVSEPIMVYGGLGDIVPIYDMRTEPMAYSVVPIDLGFL